MKSLNLKHVDWILLLFIIPIISAGLITMKSFVDDTQFFNRQILFVAISFVAFFVTSFIDFRLFKKTKIVGAAYLISLISLILLFVVGSTTRGATSWFNFGYFSFQPVDFTKLILIIILAKYFSRRHVELGNIRHVFISGLYALIPFVLVFLQPDFGSAMIIFLIWFGMILVSGIPKKYLFLVFSGAVIIFGALWLFAFEEAQKNRITSFLNPLADVQDTGYNAYQSTIAVGSGQIFGKGVGYGTQSRLKFLPEYETDFVFAAFSEEWGFVGSATILILYLLIIWRVLIQSVYGATNFEILFGVGVATMLMSHIIINIGMNIGLLPITGINLPFMSYGGSHLFTTFIALGILSSMNRDRRSVHRDDTRYEFLGI